MLTLPTVTITAATTFIQPGWLGTLWEIVAIWD
jgi:hypothetical protein